MVNFKAGELVLVSNGRGGFMVRKVASLINDEEILLSEGNYNTKYKVSSLHKCPPSIKKLYK